MTNVCDDVKLRLASKTIVKYHPPQPQNVRDDGKQIHLRAFRILGVNISSEVLIIQDNRHIFDENMERPEYAGDHPSIGAHKLVCKDVKL